MLSTAPNIGDGRPTVVAFEDLTLGYDGHAAIHHINGKIGTGTLLAIVGPNGSGKSTLLKGIIGNLRPIGGRIVIPSTERTQIAYLPQQADIDRTFPMTVFDLVGLGLWGSVGAFRPIDARGKATIEQAISAVGLEGFESRGLDQLSGGQLQRVLFARVLVQDSSLIILDEPFTAIDSKTATDLMRLIELWHTERRTVIAVLHDLELVRERFPEAVLLAREVVAWGATHEVVTSQNILKARSMSEAWDESAPWCKRERA